MSQPGENFDAGVVSLYMHMRAAGINPTIFRAYDIRGIYPDELDERAAYLIARAFARHIGAMIHGGEEKQKRIRILVSSDARASSPSLKEAFLRGLLEEGAYVIDAGLTTTPMHTFIAHHVNADGGAMITASHNPAQYNGIKLSGPHGTPVGEGSGMEEVAQMAQRGIFEEGSKKGSVSQENFLTAYIAFFAEHFPTLLQPQAFGEKPFRIALDSGDGMTGVLLSPLFGQFPSIEPIIIHEGVDMTFPHHEANPIKPETLRDLQEVVIKNKCDLGAAFDGDGDRLGLVDERGEVISSEVVAAFLVRRFRNKKQQAILYDTRSSRIVKEEIERYGGRPIESRVGYTFIKRIMTQERAVFGAEVSGHYYFKDFFYAESAIFALFTALDILREERKSIHELITNLKRYAKPAEINFTLKEGVKKDALIDYIASCFADGSISYPDGIKVLYREWWFNVRPSNTEPLIRLNIEADTKELLEEKKKLVLECIKKYTI